AGRLLLEALALAAALDIQSLDVCRLEGENRQLFLLSRWLRSFLVPLPAEGESATQCGQDDEQDDRNAKVHVVLAFGRRSTIARLPSDETTRLPRLPRPLSAAGRPCWRRGSGSSGRWSGTTGG